MRILHVVPTYLPAVRYGGPIVSVHGLCKGLAALGHDVHVFTTPIDGAKDSDVTLGKPTSMDGVTVWYFPVPFLRRLYYAPAMGAALHEVVRSFNVVHTHSVFLWPTWRAARECCKAGVPYVLSPRGMLVKELIRRKSAFSKRAWIYGIERRNVENAAAVHATSAEEASQLGRFAFRLRGKIAVIPNGVELPPLGEVSTVDDSFGMPAAPFIVFLGRISWKKGLDRLIRALHAVPSVRLVVAGNDEEGYTPRLQKLAREIGVDGRLEFIGPVYGHRKTELLSRAALLALPSYSENFGNVVLEAMSVGCPVVVTEEVGAASIVRECGAGEVLSGDPPALGEGLKRLLADSAMLRKMGANGRQAVADRFSWAPIARSMTVLYEKVAV